MSVKLESMALKSPNPSLSLLFPNRATASQSLLRPHRVSTAVRSRGFGLGLGLLPLHRHGFRNRSVFAFAASHEEESLKTVSTLPTDRGGHILSSNLRRHPPQTHMKPKEIDLEEEKSDLKVGAEESEEAWQQTLASFKEQALKMQSVSQEAYELYSKKAIVILKETSEQLKIQAEKARQDLSVIVKEISEEGKEYLSTAAEKSPEPVKDIVDTFATVGSSVNQDTKFSEVPDFFLGIPYGILLSFGGLLSFLITGSISAIRFGVILGGTLLALSILSLRSWKRGDPYPLALKGQAAIASILFLREIRLLFERPPATFFLPVLLSGAMAAFFLYRIRLNGGQTNASNLEDGIEN
ncbi:hypothetical protein RHGRI_015659 [Rhododendron griersonianum]|uniref:Protein FATTY ACID EXPORT 3, chloroplastic n=1 Tax=Rhododendron griersonianum TaxID=479676 RepID=A0AAV6KEQ5_9ERIC|nr:hypothetical protein RHGRI_015659 [Rhododendron griersonianum]